MRTKKSSLLPVILFFLSCSSGNLIIDEPLTFRQFQESIFPPDNIIACYIPASDVKLIESLLNLKNGDRIKTINGTGKYPMMMENTKSNACLSVKIVDFKIPYTTIGIFVNSLEL